MSRIGLQVVCPRSNCSLPNADSRHQCFTPDDHTSTASRYSQALATQGSMSSASSTIHGYSESSTPTSSRSPSISGSAGERSTSSTDVLGERTCNKCQGACSDPKHIQGEKKKGKEKKSRNDQARVLQNAEDVLLTILGRRPTKAQSAGNGNAAGVGTLKIEIFRIMGYVFNTHLEEEFLRAVEAGREEQWKAEMRASISTHLARWQSSDEHPRGPPHDPSFDGTLMEMSDKRDCAYADGSNKKCATHASGLNYVECRKRHRTADFERNKQVALARKRSRRA